MARSHAGESSTSYVAQGPFTNHLLLLSNTIVIYSYIQDAIQPISSSWLGLIDFLISSHPVAEILRDHVVIKVIPMVNPDGVFLGNYKYMSSLPDILPLVSSPNFSL